MEEILGTAEGEVHCQRPPPHDVIEVIDLGQIEVPDKQMHYFRVSQSILFASFSVL